MNTKWSAAGLLIAVFLAGGLSALGVERIVDRMSGPEDSPQVENRWEGRRPGRGGPPGGRPPFAELARMEFSDRLAQRLGLTEEQRETLEGIMERRRVLASNLMEELGPRLRAQMDSMEVEIREVLTDDQREAFDRFRNAEMERFRRGPPRRPGPGRDRNPA